jgi:hypothetical protein
MEDITGKFTTKEVSHPSDGDYQILCPTQHFGIRVRNGILQDCAPIVRRFLGYDVQDLLNVLEDELTIKSIRKCEKIKQVA